MAKKGMKRSVTKRRRRSKKDMVVSSGLTDPQKILVDPCAGPLDSFYPGEVGMIQRFGLDVTINTTAGFTAGYISFMPAANTYFVYGNANSSTAGVATLVNGPGASFLSTAAAKFRPVAACIEIIPSAVSATTVTGELGSAVVSVNTINASSQSVDGVFQLTQARSVLAKRSYEAKWYPGTLDSTYAPASGGTATLADQADQNAILVAYRGYPAGTALSIRMTTVLEWTPLVNTGTTVSSQPRAGTNVMAHAADLHSNHSSWWNNFADGVKSDFASAARYVSRAGLYKGAKWAEQKLLGSAASELALLTL